MYCQKCGSNIADDANFCQKCGSKIDHDNLWERTMKPILRENSIEIVDAADKSSLKSSKGMALILATVIAVSIIGIIIRCAGGIIGGSFFSPYKEASDLEIISTYVKDGKGYFAVKNTGEQAIKDFTLTVVGYDSSGNTIDLTRSTTYESFDFLTANVMPGSVFGPDHYVSLNSNVKYMDIMVSSITYKDGTTWSAKGLNAWAKDISSKFSIENYKQSIENMKTDAILAEDNPYLKIVFTKKYNNNLFSDKDDIDLMIRNTSERVIQNFNVIVLEYDTNGYAIDVSPYDFAIQNAVNLSIDPANTPIGAEERWNYPLFFEPACKSHKALVYEIEFKDGTIWINERAFQWMLYNEDER